MDFKISCLLFIHDDYDRLLLLNRKKAPNLGKWSPPGGKLETSAGESPVECAKREAFEETNLVLKDDDLRLLGYVSEKNYEGKSHWLMFLFESKKTLSHLPSDIDEGCFNFFHRHEIEKLEIPSSDHQLVWPVYDKRHSGFIGIRADCASKSPDLKIEVFL